MTYVDYVTSRLEKKTGRGRKPAFKIVLSQVEDLNEMLLRTHQLVARAISLGIKEGDDVSMANVAKKLGTVVNNHLPDELDMTYLVARKVKKRVSYLRIHNPEVPLDDGEFVRKTNDWIVKVGAFLLEAEYHTGYIKITPSFREKTEFGIVQVYLLEQGDNFSSVELSGRVATVTKKPADIDKLMQPCRSLVMKRWTKDRAQEFKTYLSCDEDPDRPEAFIMAANVLQQTAWRINQKVLEIVAGSHWDKYEYEIDKEDPDYDCKRSKVRDNCVVLRKAINFSELKEFYQYVSTDWRGRVYYNEPYLNFQGSDLARGLLQFVESKPLGPRGEYWLAIHTANSFNMSYGIDEIPEWCTHNYREMLESQGLTSISVDKMHLDDRYLWTMEHMTEIEMTAILGGLPDCEKPVSYLAACLEWLNVNKLDNPEWYFCSLPIGVDVSNNGWQHLGAMLKDTQTGSLVGLTVEELPNDLYVTVAKRLTERMPEFFAEKNMPMKAIRKGIAKRGTMTKAYSAGEEAIAENMWADVKQYGFNHKYGITEEDCNQLSKELCNAIREVCAKPMDAMDTLQDIAKAVIKSGSETVCWQSPAGYPVEQAYWNSDNRRYKVEVSPIEGAAHHGPEHPLGERIRNKNKELVGYNGRIKLVFKEILDSPNRQKHAKSISPNFVHSQDASHLALTVANWGSSFGAVHDSFSVHACDIDDLLDLTKTVFIEMYDEPNFLANLAEEIGVEVNVPDLGDLNINEVMQSDYFFA